MHTAAAVLAHANTYKDADNHETCRTNYRPRQLIVCIESICRPDTHHDTLVPTSDTELLVGAGLATQAGAAMSTGQQLGAALVAGQPPARSPTGQITPPLQVHARHSFQPDYCIYK